ncbi:MAG: Mur ligase family protein [Nitrospirota bacterium]|nr:Mur ligase family protein [Nitrospirota bacterium]MDP2384203.1 Mur ligase family protein [Nitrospirota bacterium]MDP3598285.1 Mur ligase family protein [Nitrospirota bacterium]
MPDTDSMKFPRYQAVPFSSYKEVTDFLRELETACILRGQPSDGTVSFGALARCLHELGRPDRAYRSVHITGTNGKTSVSRMTAALIQASGMKVGLYTSPHLGHFRERIAVNGQPISERELLDACNHLKSLMDWAGAELTSFEFLTAAAFFAFRTAKVDYAVVEVGIGGRQDATNIIAPEVSVITNVDYDHMDILGDRLEQIAAEKSGIIKPLTPVVCGPMQEGPRSLILSRAEQLKAPVLSIGQEYDTSDFVRTGYRGTCTIRVGSTIWEEVTVDSPAAFMATNAAHAVAAYDVLRRRGLVTALDGPALRHTFEQIHLPACCEVLPGHPTIIIDGAHNAPAAASLSSTIRSVCEGRRTVLLVSLSREKEFEKIIRHLACAGADRAIFTRYPQDRSVDPQDLSDIWRSCTPAAAEIVGDPDDAFRRAVQGAGSQGLVVVTGSLELGGYCRPLAQAALSDVGV